MFKKLFVITMLVASISGCTIVHKSQTKVIKLMPETNKPSKEEKVWIEAKTNKVWVNQHVDENGDMVEGHYKHIVMAAGHWTVSEDGKK